MKTLNTVRMVVEQKEDAYAVLGIDRGASDDAVRVAYRRMAKKHHPDKGGSEEEFLRVQEAYQVLSDPDRRSVYDHAGWGGFDKSFPGSPGGVHDMPDFFQHIFGGGVPHHPGAGAPRPGHRFNYFHMGPVQGRSASSTASTGSSDSKKRRLPDRGIDLAVSLQEAYNGATIRYRLKRKRYKGNTQAFSPTACSQCDGAGQVPVRPPDMPNFLIMMPIAMAVCRNVPGWGYLSVRKRWKRLSRWSMSRCPNTARKIIPLPSMGRPTNCPVWRRAMSFSPSNMIFPRWTAHNSKSILRTSFRASPSLWPSACKDFPRTWSLWMVSITGSSYPRTHPCLRIPKAGIIFTTSSVSFPRRDSTRTTGCSAGAIGSSIFRLCFLSATPCPCAGLWGPQPGIMMRPRTKIPRR